MFHSPASVTWIANAFTVTDLDISSCGMFPAAGTDNDTIGISAVTGWLDATVDVDEGAILAEQY